jgi:O-antigen/teichoic acid export membrane protein
LPERVRRHFAHGQHRTAYYLTLSNLLGAATGLLFWILLTRLGGLSPAVLGVGYAVVAIGTVIAVLAKGGLDISLLQAVPGATRGSGAGLLALALVVGSGIALTLTAAVALVAWTQGLLPELTPWGWALVGATSILLLLTWLQDAYFVALGHAKSTLQRNVVLSAGRLLLPLPVIALAFAYPVPLTWALALAASAAVGAWHARRLPDRAGRQVPRREFLRSAARNFSGSAAEFLPGLLLVPFILARDGPAAAAYFGIAWTVASLVFQTSGVLGRSALAEMIQTGPAGRSSAIRKGAVQHLCLVAPLALLGVVLAPHILAVFGPEYAANGALALALLCASALFVAPISLYLAVLRSGRDQLALVLFPAAMIASLAIWVSVLDASYGLTGVALAWLLSNAPFGLYAAWRLRRAVLEVMPLGLPSHVRRGADVE